MEIWLVAVFTGVVGLSLGVLGMRLYAAAPLAAAVAERDILRERVVDLEAAASGDAETAAALAPLRETLRRVETQVGTLERDRVAQFATIRGALARVEDSATALGAETRALAGSLNASTTRGAWGEVQLRRVLEHAGMLPRCDFDEQVATTTRDGRGVRPDVVVHLPGGRNLVIDAKAPMTRFLAAQAEDLAPSERSVLLREHSDALRAHVRMLAGKGYWSAFETTPELVVCFVPSDAMLAGALTAAPELHEEAMARGVVLVGPAALLALLRAVAVSWQQDSLTSGARELLLLGRELHDRLATMGGHVHDVGKALTRSVESYNKLVGTLESRVLVSARRMADLGVASTLLEVHEPVTHGPRPLTAYELIEHVTAEDARPQLETREPAAGTDQVTGDVA